MNHKYHVGEVLIIRPNVSQCAMHLVGTECEVLMLASGFENGIDYQVSCVDGHDWFAAENQLRRRGESDERTREKTTTWERCAWRPSHIEARIENEEVRLILDDMWPSS